MPLYYELKLGVVVWLSFFRCPRALSLPLTDSLHPPSLNNAIALLNSTTKAGNLRRGVVFSTPVPQPLSIPNPQEER